MLLATKFLYQRQITSIREEYEKKVNYIHRCKTKCTDVYDRHVSLLNGRLSSDVMVEILSYLPFDFVMKNCACVDTQWNYVSNCDQLWEEYLNIWKTSLSVDSSLGGSSNEDLQLSCPLLSDCKKQRFLNEFLYYKWGRPADQLERVLHEHSELVKIYKNTGGHGRHTKPGLISIQDTANGELVDVYFVSWKHLYGWLGVLLPLFTAVCASLKQSSISPLLTREDSVVGMVVLATMMGALVRYSTWEVYFDEMGKYERKNFERLPITFLVLLWGVLITFVTLSKPL